MKRKWHKINEVTDEELCQESGFHVWGSRLGMHAVSYSTKSGFRSLHNDDLIGVGRIQLLMPFPQTPRKRNIVTN